MVYSIPDFKMASNGNTTWNMERFSRGRASALIDALAYFENRRNKGRAGRTPLNFIRTPNFEENRMGENQFPCGRALTLTVMEPHPGGLSSWRGRGIDLSPPTPTTPPSSQPVSSTPGSPGSIPTQTQKQNQ